MTLIEIIFCLALTMVAMVGVYHLGIVVMELIKITRNAKRKETNR